MMTQTILLRNVIPPTFPLVTSKLALIALPESLIALFVARLIMNAQLVPITMLGTQLIRENVINVPMLMPKLAELIWLLCYVKTNFIKMLLIAINVKLALMLMLLPAMLLDPSLVLAGPPQSTKFAVEPIS